MTTVEFDRNLHLLPVVGRFNTVANLITIARTVVAVALGGAALAHNDMTLLVLGYATYWLGDMLDGWSARRLDQETRLGAVLDIISDRACTAILCSVLIAHVAGVAPVGVVFLLSFMVLDTMLSLAFLCWPLISPNQFYLVDRLVWQLNWSPVAKATNTASVIVAVGAGAPAVGLCIAVAIVAVKVWSAARVMRLIEDAAL